MFVSHSSLTALIARISVVALFAAVIGGPAGAGHVPGAAPMTQGHNAVLVLPIMNPDRGKRHFVDKGCIACHAINGIGGHDAPNMDAHATMGYVNPFDFAASMWNHAGAMISAQEEALGEQIYFIGEELADIIAFVHDHQSQHTFSEADMTPKARKMMDHRHGDTPGPEAHAKELGHHGRLGMPKHAN